MGKNLLIATAATIGLLANASVVAQTSATAEKSDRASSTAYASVPFAVPRFESRREASNSFFTGENGEKITSFQSGMSFTIKIGAISAAKRTFKFLFQFSDKRTSPVEFQTITTTGMFRGFQQKVFVDDYPAQVASFTVQEFVNGRFVTGATCFRSSFASH